MTHTIEQRSSGIQPLKLLVAFESDEESPANVTKIIHQLFSFTW